MKRGDDIDFNTVVKTINFKITFNNIMHREIILTVYEERWH